ncbi:ABC transporter permease [bacterium]|nr:ABC transporter permease [bacterium]
MPSHPISGPRSRLFSAGIFAFLALFLLMVLALLAADVAYINLDAVKEVLRSREIRAAVVLSLWSSTLTMVIAIIFAVPMGYALSRYRFPGRILADTIVDLPIVFPPLVVGLSLLVFFRTSVGLWLESLGMDFVYQRRGIILAQFFVSASFGIRAIKTTFDEVDRRQEDVALTLGCTRGQAFWRVALRNARGGIIAGAILTWARAFGLFGPLMVFVGAVRMKTEVLPTTIYLETSIGRIEVALAVSLLMIVMATIALILIRLFGGERLW